MSLSHRRQKDRYDEQVKEAGRYAEEPKSSREWMAIRQALIASSLQLSFAEQDANSGLSGLTESHHAERLASIDQLNRAFYTELQNRRRLPTRQFETVYWELKSERRVHISDQPGPGRPREQTPTERYAVLNKRIRDDAREQLRDTEKKERYKADLIEQAHRKEALRKLRIDRRSPLRESLDADEAESSGEDAERDAEFDDWFPNYAVNR